MGLCIEFKFPDDQIIRAVMCYSTFPRRIISRLPPDLCKEFLLHWLGTGDEYEDTYGLENHTCKFVKEIYRICQEEGFLPPGGSEVPISMHFC